MSQTQTPSDLPDSAVPAAPATLSNFTFDELRVGQSLSTSRSLTPQDLRAFAVVSGDLDPDRLEAPDERDGEPTEPLTAPGMWSAALIASLISNQLPGPGTVQLEQHLRFHAALRVGDTVKVSLKVVDKDDANHHVRIDCSATNQHGHPIVSGHALVCAPNSRTTRERGIAPAMLLFDASARLQHWVASLEAASPERCAVVHPCDEVSLRGMLESRDAGLITPVVLAPIARVRALAAQHGLSLDGIELIDTPHSHASAASAASLAAQGRVGMMMKGSLHTDELMQAVLAEAGLRTGRRMSHVFRFEIPAYPRPLLITDAAISIAPDLEQKRDIVQNAIDLAHALGIVQPRVALLSAVETVTPRLTSTVDAAALCKMAQRGQIIGAVLDGPLAFDNAISVEAARLKGIDSPVAGQADILVVPDLEAGNMLAKQLEYLAGAAGCGVVLGARVPIALTSRADPPASRMASAALAGVVARAGRR